MSFSDRLKEARKKAGLTQEELAKESKVSTGTIQRYELGTRNPKKETIAKIAKALNVGYGYTQNGEPYFYKFVDTVLSEEYKDNEEFNKMQLENAEKKDLFVEKMREMGGMLNDTGQDKATTYVEDLTKIPEYRKDSE